MRAPLNPVLLVITAVALAVGGCASQPKDAQTASAAKKAACSDDPSNPLHLTTLHKKEVPRDPQLESLLTEGGSPRLQAINQEMYQTLRALDVELRREQAIAACERGDSDIHSLQAQSTPAAGGSNAAGSGTTSGGGAAAGGGFGLAGTTVAATDGPNSAAAPNGGTATGAAATAVANSPAGLTASGTGTTAATARTTLVRKASVPPTTTASSGNGATAQKVPSGSDNDIVARRLRKAAEQETDPTLKAKLWKEYAQYEQGNAAK
jgi:hypothetical protein